MELKTFELENTLLETVSFGSPIYYHTKDKLVCDICKGKSKDGYMIYCFLPKQEHILSHPGCLDTLGETNILLKVGLKYFEEFNLHEK